MTIDVRDKLLDAHIHVHSPDFTKYPLAPGFERSDLWYPSMTPDDYAGYARRLRHGAGEPRPADMVRPRSHLHHRLHRQRTGAVRWNGHRARHERRSPAAAR